jgi:hypothetical protein
MTVTDLISRGSRQSPTLRTCIDKQATVTRDADLVGTLQSEHKVAYRSAGINLEIDFEILLTRVNNHIDSRICVRIAHSFKQRYPANPTRLTATIVVGKSSSP